MLFQVADEPKVGAENAAATADSQVRAAEAGVDADARPSAAHSAGHKGAGSTERAGNT